MLLYMSELSISLLGMKRKIHVCICFYIQIFSFFSHSFEFVIDMDFACMDSHCMTSQNWHHQTNWKGKNKMKHVILGALNKCYV